MTWAKRCKLAGLVGIVVGMTMMGIPMQFDEASLLIGGFGILVFGAGFMSFVAGRFLD